MKKTTKFAIYTCIALVAAGLLAFVALKFYFTPERIKKYALEFASKNLNREIRLADASLSLGGIRLEGLSVSEYPDFKKGEFFSAKSISVRPSFSALLRKEVKINSLSAFFGPSRGASRSMARGISDQAEGRLGACRGGRLRPELGL